MKLKTLSLIIAVIMGQKLWAQADPAGHCRDLGEAQRQCCLMALQLRQAESDVVNLGLGDNREEYLRLKQRNDQITAELTIAKGLESLRQDFLDFQSRVASPEMAQAPLASLVDQLQKDHQVIQRMHAIHATLDEIAGHENLRSPASVEELRSQIQNHCAGSSHSQRTQTMCQALGLSSSNGGTIPFSDAEFFMGAFLEAYFYAGQTPHTDPHRLEQVRQYRHILGGAQNAAVLDQLVQIEQQASPELRAASGQFQDATGNLTNDQLKICLEHIRYEKGTEAACERPLQQLEDQILAQRQQFLNVVSADQTLARLIPESLAEASNITDARQQGRARLADLKTRLSRSGADGRALTGQIQRLEQGLSIALQNPTLTTPQDQLLATFYSGQNSEAQQQQNFDFLQSTARELISSGLRCSGPAQNFIVIQDRQFKLQRQELYDCLKQTQGQHSLAPKIAELERARADVHQRMQEFTARPAFKEAQAFRNYLGYRVQTQCAGGPEVQAAVQLGTCRDSAGGRDLNIVRLLADTGQVLAEYTNDASNPHRQSVEETTLMHNFCVRNQSRYQTMCNEITRNYGRRTADDTRERDGFREYFRTTATQMDIRTGETRRVDRPSTGHMLANAVGSSLVNNIGWGLNYWQTEQMLPYYRDMAIYNKTQQYYQQQYWQYMQQSYYSPLSFFNYSGGFQGYVPPSAMYNPQGFNF